LNANVVVYICMLIWKTDSKAVLLKIDKQHYCHMYVLYIVHQFVGMSG